ncbi:MAG: cupin domain-containing protein [Deltaproteobacteria bacterium]|jgi:transcriptional regulator with XRE-family HTH domain|nr:cupin domain-containing protein [Deltaproteobacteria bacterium]
MKQNATLGSRVRKYREAREISRVQLAELAGLTEIFLASLEDDDVYPSIGPLQKVARALGVRLGTFMDDEITRDPIISRAGDRAADLTMHKARNSRTELVYHALGKGKSDRNMEPFYIEIMPDEQDAEHKLSSHQGEEFILVVKGRLFVAYGREEHILEAGDTIYYNSIVPHHVGAYGNEAAEIVAVIYHP